MLYKHALRNALLPVVTVLGLQFGNVLAGAILVETVFNWPGLGRLAFESVLRRDYPTILGVLLFSSIVVVVMNLLTDLATGSSTRGSGLMNDCLVPLPPGLAAPPARGPEARSAAHVRAQPVGHLPAG